MTEFLHGVCAMVIDPINGITPSYISSFYEVLNLFFEIYWGTGTIEKRWDEFFFSS